MSMRIKAVIAVVIFLYMGAIQTLGQGEIFSPKNHSFSIKMPRAPKCVSEPVDMLGETIELHICAYADEPVQLFYSITYFKRPRSSFAVDDKTALRGARNGALAMTNTRLISEREVTVDGNLGLECVLRANDINMLSTKLFVITKQEMVVADMSGQPGKMPEKEVRAFLDSLRFTASHSSLPPR